MITCPFIAIHTSVTLPKSREEIGVLTGKLLTEAMHDQKWLCKLHRLLILPLKSLYCSLMHFMIAQLNIAPWIMWGIVKPASASAAVFHYTSLMTHFALSWECIHIMSFLAYPLCPYPISNAGANIPLPPWLHKISGHRLCSCCVFSSPSLTFSSNI